jgi:hypothetical protein
VTCSKCGAKLPERLGAVCPRCLLEGELEPAVLGGTLELGEELGRGGMGTVYRAKHLRLGRTVAVKLLPEDLASQPEFRARFEREARVLAMLAHPHIVTVHDFGQEDDQSWIVMELVEGSPLSRAIPLPVKRAVEVLAQVCDAVGYAHKRGVVHRDLKPANILLDPEGRAKVTDFGIARLVSEAGHGWTVTKVNEAVGTIGYLAPEVLEGAGPDPRQDVYALGVVLYELVTGKLPVGAFDPAPAPLDDIVRRALAPDPARRYADANELREALARTTATVAAVASAETAPIAVASGDLDDDELAFLRATALVEAIATGIVVKAFLVSVTPLKVTAQEPLSMSIVERDAKGELWSRARFETWPTVGALAAIVVGLVVYGLLRQRWKKLGLLVAQPDKPLGQGRCVLHASACGLALFVARKALEAGGDTKLVAYVPVVGAALLIIIVFHIWTALLEAWRTKRSILRERRLLIGGALMLVPPATELLLFITRG